MDKTTMTSFGHNKVGRREGMESVRRGLVVECSQSFRRVGWVV